MRAIWQNKVLAESGETVSLEGHEYFPPSSVKMEYLKKSGGQYVCPWKGTADYYDVVVDGEVNGEAAWVYEKPKKTAKKIAGYFGFWRGVEIKE